MLNFFRSKPKHPAHPTGQEDAPQGEQQAQGKPTGQFSPKQIRAFFLIGVLVVLFFIVTTGQNSKPANKALPKGQDPRASATNPNAPGTRDYGNAVSQVLKQSPNQPQQYPAFGQAPNFNSYPTASQQPAGSYPPYSGGSSPAASYPPNGTPIYAQAPYAQGAPYSSAPMPSGGTAPAAPRDPQQEAREAMQVDDDKREHDSLSSAVIIRSERLHPANTAPATTSATGTAPASTPPASPTPQASGAPIATGSASAAPTRATTPAGTPSQQVTVTASSVQDDLPSRTSRPQRRDQSASNRAVGATYKLFEGVLIETVLTNRLNSSFTGPVECMVTTDVWSHSREHLLIPQGTKVLGEARRVTQTAQARLAVIFHRLIMPDGYSVSLDNFTGLSQIGETGLSDKVNHHYVQIFGVSVALGAIAGLAVRGTSLGTTPTAGDAFRQGFSQQLSQEGTQILDRFLNVLPTVTIREGVRVKVYLLDDLSLPAYDQHRIATDL
jgi:type IV secretion system protein VirB10